MRSVTVDSRERDVVETFALHCHSPLPPKRRHSVRYMAPFAIYLPYDRPNASSFIVIIVIIVIVVIVVVVVIFKNIYTLTT